MTKSNLIKPAIPKDLFKYIAVFAGIVLIVIYGIFFLKINFKTVMILFGFVLIGAVSRLPQRMAPVAIGIELVSLVTIVSAMKYSPVIGALVGVSAAALSGFYTIERPQDVIVMSIGFIGMGLLTPLLVNWFGLGIGVVVITAIYDLFTGIFYSLTGHSWVGVIRFAAMHIPFNFFVVIGLSPMLMVL
ncbi:MAG: hypothetical protein QF475_01970 [Candidatus Undinarchaeales archaeon]|jgi:hypothetical protein|nr:hypothetical protein [Candidatus Undinarchaeales archaeon]